jgi:pilus assembly protein Flp/PilA
MLTMLRTYLRALLKSERGATAVEYGIMVALIAVAIITAVSFVGDALERTFTTVANTIP